MALFYKTKHQNGKKKNIRTKVVETIQTQGPFWQFTHDFIKRVFLQRKKLKVTYDPLHIFILIYCLVRPLLFSYVFTNVLKTGFFNHTGFSLEMVQPLRQGYTGRFNRSDYLPYISLKIQHLLKKNFKNT